MARTARLAFTTSIEVLGWRVANTRNNFICERLANRLHAFEIEHDTAKLFEVRREPARFRET